MNIKADGGKGSKPQNSKGNSKEKDELKKVKFQLKEAEKEKAVLLKQLESFQVRIKSLENNFDYAKVRSLLPSSQDQDGIFADENARLLDENKKLQKKKEDLEKELSEKAHTSPQKDLDDDKHGNNTDASPSQDGMPPDGLIITQSSIDDLKAQHKDQLDKINRELKTTRAKLSAVEKEKSDLEEENRRLSDDSNKRNEADFKKKDDQIEALTIQVKKIANLEAEKDELKKRLQGNEVTAQLKKIKEENETLKKEIGEKQRQFEEIIKENKKNEMRLQAVQKQTEIDANNSKDAMAVSGVNTELLEKSKDLERQLQDKDDALSNLTSEKSSLQRKCQESENKLEEIRKQCEAQLNEKEDEFKVERKSFEREKSTLNKDIQKLKSTIEGLEKRSKNSTNTNIREIEKENENLKTRLSQMAGAQLMSNNPSIADLSDVNRPTKLAEQYSELYDNEWTSVFEVLESNTKSESEIIKTLYGILIEIFNFCSKLSTHHSNLLKSAVTSIDFTTKTNHPVTHIDDSQIIPTKLRQLKDLRKAFAPDMTDSIFGLYVEKQQPKHFEKPEMKEFVKKCVTLCWYMSVQDPPVIIDTQQHTGSFNGDIFKTYTKTGKTLAYIVWPPLYLHKGGPMLSKGVAQGK